MPPPAHRVFISSTFKDLEQYRVAVGSAIRQLGAVDIAMEHFGATDKQSGNMDFMLRCLEEATVRSEQPFVDAVSTTSTLDNFEAKYWSLMALDRIASETARAALRKAVDDEDPQISDAARSLCAKWGEAPPPKEVEQISVEVRGRTLKLPSRIFNPLEHNAEYILIPGGRYKYSVNNKETLVESLYVAKYPVTNRQYRRFVKYLRGEEVLREEESVPLSAFTPSLLSRAKGVKGMVKEIGRPETWGDYFESRYADDKRFNGDDQPVVVVNWYGVVAYCHWLSELSAKLQSAGGFVYRLPKEEEWEWAAGGGKRIYPWGEKEPDKTTSVGSYPAGATPEGLMDTAGNVWEWMDNLYETGKPRSALRGGSWGVTSEDLRCDARYFNNSVSWVYLIGFRVVCGRQGGSQSGF